MNRFIIALIIAGSAVSLEAFNWFKSKETQREDLRKDVTEKANEAEKEVAKAEKAVKEAEKSENKLAEAK